MPTTRLAPRIVLATGNAGKVREMNHILAAWHTQVHAQSEFNVPEADETGMTFVENAMIKARNACSHTKLPALADDSGLEVHALHGEPGIYSARYAGPNASDKDNVEKLLAALHGVPEAQRGARFVCAMVYLRHPRDPVPVICQATWEGRILTAPRGEHGFGYDPVFWVPEQNCASAELPPDVKNRISHRAQALRCLLDAFQPSTPAP